MAASSSNSGHGESIRTWRVRVRGAFAHFSDADSTSRHVGSPYG